MNRELTANHALRRTRPSRSGCSRHASWPPSLGWSSRSIFIRPLLAILFFARLACGAEPSAERIQSLIEKLAITNAPASLDPIFTPSKDTPKTDRRVIAYDAADELGKLGIDAFPYLLESLGDKRQSVALRRVLPSTVGDACYCIVTEQLYALPRDYRGSFYRTGADGQLHERPVFSKQLLTPANLKEWLAARHDRTLAELQLEALGWVLGQEERIGAQTRDAEEEYLTPLRAKHAELKKQVETLRRK